MLCIGFCFSGCSLKQNRYSEFCSFDDGKWAYADSLMFTPELEDSIVSGMLTVCVRHSHAYPYSNLWIEVAQKTTDSTTIKDTVEIRLADDFGRWFGNGTGVSYQLVDTLPRPYTLVNGRPLQVRHIMRNDTLAEIEQIGVAFLPR